jgi:DNA polymerase III delta prime subunit
MNSARTADRFRYSYFHLDFLFACAILAGFVNAENVYRVCDSPHPATIQGVIADCLNGDLDKAVTAVTELWKSGYSAIDIVGTVFKVIKSFEPMHEALKMDLLQTVSAIHIRIVDGVTTLLQMQGLVAKMAAAASKAKAAGFIPGPVSASSGAGGAGAAK